MLFAEFNILRVAHRGLHSNTFSNQKQIKCEPHHGWNQCVQNFNDKAETKKCNRIFFVFFENLILAEISVLTLDHQEFEIIGTLDF